MNPVNSLNPAVGQFVRTLIQQIDPALAAMSQEELSALLKSPSSSPACSPPVSTSLSTPPRWQDSLIEGLIPVGSSVLDLGCGGGQLLSRLIHDKGVRGQGIELDAEAVFGCVERGVPVFQSNLDEGLRGFADQSFDYVILEETLQTLHHPVAVLDEVLRVGRTGIISFPNFGYWRVRLDLALRGRMPRTETLPYHWYDTPNIHLLTLADFLSWAAENHVRIAAGHVLAGSAIRPLDPQLDTLSAEEALLVVQRA